MLLHSEKPMPCVICGAVSVASRLPSKNASRIYTAPKKDVYSEQHSVNQMSHVIHYTYFIKMYDLMQKQRLLREDTKNKCFFLVVEPLRRGRGLTLKKNRENMNY